MLGKTNAGTIAGTNACIGAAYVPLSDKAVGDIVKINVDGTATDFIIVHQGLPSDKYYENCNGTWLLMKDIYEERKLDGWEKEGVYPIGYNDYRNSDLHAYLNDTFLNFFDSNIKSAIKQVTIPYFSGKGNSGTVRNGLYGLSTKIFLLSELETGYSGSSDDEDNDVPFIGTKLSYFLRGTDTAANNKRIANYDGYATSWFLRSPSINGDYTMKCVIWTGDYANHNCDDPLGVRPALILGSSTLVDGDGNVIA